MLTVGGGELEVGGIFRSGMLSLLATLNGYAALC